MFRTVKTLILGASASSETAVRDHFALDLIDQKIRETETALSAAKTTLASQIQKVRTEQAQMETLKKRIADLSKRTKQAAEAGKQDIALDAAGAVASLESEQAVRQQTLDRITAHIEKLRLSIESGQRRLLDLKQGAMSARAVRAEQKAKSALAKVSAATPAHEAQALIDEVLTKESPSELADIYDEIEAEVSHSNIEQRLGEAGFGDKPNQTAQDVLARLTA